MIGDRPDDTAAECGRVAARIASAELPDDAGPRTERVDLGLDVSGRRIGLTSLERILWPWSGFTKRRMLAYYAAVAPVLLPHLRDRALTLGRWPEGVDRRGWFQAECRGRPEWLRVHRQAGKRGIVPYCVVDDLAGLLFVANLGTIELHPFLWRLSRPAEPTALVFDLDPGAPASIAECCRVALLIGELLDADGLTAVAKTSGSLGLHLYVPLQGGATFEETKAFARSLAGRLARGRPDLVIDRVSRSERAGRVFIDWVQNDPSRSTVAPYSLRAVNRPLVSTPVAWSEVVAAAATGRAEALRFGPLEVLRRLARDGDLAAPLLGVTEASSQAPPSERSRIVEAPPAARPR